MTALPTFDEVMAQPDQAAAPALPTFDEAMAQGEPPPPTSATGLANQAIRTPLYVTSVIMKAFGHDKPADPNLGLEPDAVEAMKSSGEWNDYVKEHTDFHAAMNDGVVKPAASDMQAAFIRNTFQALGQAGEATGQAVFEPYKEQGVPGFMRVPDIAMKTLGKIGNIIGGAFGAATSPIQGGLTTAAEPLIPAEAEWLAGALKEAAPDDPRWNNLNPESLTPQVIHQIAQEQGGDLLNAVMLGTMRPHLPGFAATAGPWGGLQLALAEGQAHTVIGPGVTEGRYLGTEPLTPEQVAIRDQATKALPTTEETLASYEKQIGDLQEQIETDPQKADIYRAQLEKVTAARDDLAKSMVPPAEQNIHQVAASIDPEAVAQSNAAEARQQLLRDNIQRLKAEQQAEAEANAPHNEEIARLQESLADASKRQQKIAQAKIDDLTERNKAWIEEQTATETPEIQALREGIQSLHETRADYAERLSAAYREAQSRMPEEAAPEAAAAPQEAAKEEPATQASAEPAPEAALPPSRTTEQQHAAIVDDIVKQATKAGYSAEEAKSSAELLARQYRYLADTYGGKKGTAEELYAKEKPQIIGQGAKIKAKGRELAQEGKGNYQLKPSTAKDMDIGSDKSGRHVYQVVNKDGAHKGFIDIDSIKDGVARIGDIIINSSEEPSGNIGVGGIKDILRQLRTFHPEIKEIEGERVSGARKEGGHVYAGQGIEVRQKLRTLLQSSQGKYHILDDGRRLIRLMKSADASTLIHEGAHHFLDMMKRFEAEDGAPQKLKDDMKTIRDWLGVKEDGLFSTRHEEKFARGFERYVMEGHAPSKALIPIFQKFEKWLTAIYKSVKDIPQQTGGITDSIRDFFDRVIEPNAALRDNPRNTIIAPDREPGKMLADIHEADAAHTPPEQAASAADTIREEIDATANLHKPEIRDAIKAAEAKVGTGEIAGAHAGDAVPGRAAGEPVAGGPGAAPEPDAVAAGRNAAPAEGGAARGAGRSDTEQPGNPNARFKPESKFVDKAGNIRLDLLNTTEDINEVLRQTAIDNHGFDAERRGVVSNGLTLDLADALGMNPGMLNMRKLGEAFNAEGIVAAVKLLVQSAGELRKAAESGDAALYAEVKARHQMIQGHVSGITAEAGRALQIFQALKKIEGYDQAKALGDFLKDTDNGKTLFQLQEEMNFAAKLNTPQQLSKFVQDSGKRNFKGMMLEYYINALISGPITHARYAAGNAVKALWTPLVQVPIASGIGLAREAITGIPAADRVYMGEAGAQLYGLLKGSQKGLYTAAEAFKTGLSPALPGERVSAQFSEGQRMVNAIPGKVGEIINIPSKSVSAIHSFFKSVRYEQNIHGLAYRAAMREGLQGDAFANRIADLTSSPTPEMMQAATKDALKELYMAPTDYHSGMAGLIKFTNEYTLAKIMVPFMKIGSQITREAFVESTPLGVFSKEVRANLLGENGGAARDSQIAKMTAGIALLGGTAMLVAEGMATGDGPDDPEKRRVWLLSHRPNSIQIGSITIPYQGLGSLGMLMRFSANMYETASHASEEDGTHLAKSFFYGLTKSVLDENFMRGFHDALDAVYNPQEHGGSYIRSFVTNWLPFSVGMSQVARQIDPYHREAHSIFDAARAKMPVASEGLFPQRDMFGIPIPNGRPLVDYTNDPVVQRMDALSMGVGRLERKIRSIPLTDQQYDDYSRIAGGLAKARLDKVVAAPKFATLPPAIQIETIRKNIDAMREAARQQIMKQYPQLIQQAAAAKKAALQPPAR